MRQNERTTIYVDFQHVQTHNVELADAIQNEFHYLEAYLRVGVFNVIANLAPQYATEGKDFHIAMFNMPSLVGIRDLKTSKVASLIRFVRFVQRKA
jgi:DNA replication licensing factor MCM6